MKTFLVLLSSALALGGASALRADPFEFHVDLDTSGLLSADNAPFFLDFQLNEGSGTLANSVTLSNFSFDSGASSGSAMMFGNATGSMASSITLSADSGSPFNELFQGFSTTTTGIHFNVSISQNSPGATPDGFAVSVLTSEANNPQIPTAAPDGVSLVTLDIGTANVLADVKTYGSVSPAGVSASASASAVPEPSTTAALFGLAATTLAGVFRLRRRSPLAA